MGEKADEVAGSDPLGASQPNVNGDELEGSASASGPGDDEEIAAARANIEQTRVEMSETIDAIEEKLSPEHLKEQAKEGIKQAAIGKARQALGTASRKTAERAGTVTSTARGAGSAASRRVKQKPIPVGTAGISLAGLAIGARMIRVRRRRPEEASQARNAAPAEQALNWVQRMVGHIVGQAQGAATRNAGRDLHGVNQQDTKPSEQGRLPIRPRAWLRLDTPVAVTDLVAGLGLAIALGTLRRRRSTASLVRPLFGSQKRRQSAPIQDTGSRMEKRLLLIIALAVPAGLLAAKKLRQSTGQERTMTPTDLVVAWLNNAYSMEIGLVRTLQGHAKDAQDFPRIQARIQQHVEETRRHADLVRAGIERLGGSRSGLRSSMATVVGKTQAVATRPAQDKAVKNALADSSAEQLEICSYKALIAAAQELGDQETVSMCRQILQDEEEMARFLDQNLPTVVTETMNRIPVAAS